MCLNERASRRGWSQKGTDTERRRGGAVLVHYVGTRCMVAIDVSIIAPAQTESTGCFNVLVRCTAGHLGCPRDVPGLRFHRRFDYTSGSQKPRPSSTQHPPHGPHFHNCITAVPEGIVPRFLFSPTIYRSVCIRVGIAGLSRSRIVRWLYYRSGSRSSC